MLSGKRQMTGSVSLFHNTTDSRSKDNTLNYQLYHSYLFYLFKLFILKEKSGQNFANHFSIYVHVDI